jgi:hypothetical protein
MNGLSILIYAGDVADGLKELFWVAAGTIVLLGLIPMTFWTIEWLDGERPRPWYGRFACAVAILALLSVMIPSRQTVYLIAASEAGEVAVTSETGQRLLAKIEAALDAQIGGGE